MAGYIMTLDSEDSLVECISNGVYSTRFKEQTSNHWNTAYEGTFADYFSMKQGDLIFFFIKRKIYGVGELVDVCGDCKYFNYENADLPANYSIENYRQLEPLVDWGNPGNRCICVFKPHPFFFKKGVDMDEALSSNPEKFKMLRAMWKLSFVKIDDEESQALFDVILKRNEDNYINGKNVFSYDSNIHSQIEHKIKQFHRMKAYSLLSQCANGKGQTVNHEMAIEAYLCSVLGKENDTPMGKWDYVSHQVIASPFKAIDYMDKMDLFGYRYIKGYPTVSKYLVAEVKKDMASVNVIEQIMKYVDWVNQEYAHGDYSMIEAYVVASDFPDDVIIEKNKHCIRNFSRGYRPTEAATWNNVKLIRYEYIDNRISFSEI